MLFVDEVRKTMPDDTVLGRMKHAIMEAARDGLHECRFDRPFEEWGLEDEIQWLRNQGFVVEEATTRPSYNYYSDITVKW